jgi:Flp pilus assembly protein TadG
MFLVDKRGSIAVIFSLTLIPVLGIAGVALDYSRMSGSKISLQKSVDAAAIAALANLPTATAPDATKSTRFFNANKNLGAVVD